MFNLKKEKETSKPEQRATVKEHDFGNGVKAVTYELEVNTPVAAGAISAVVSSLRDLGKYEDYVDVVEHAAFIHGTLCGYECSKVLTKEVADNLNDLVERVTKDKLDAIKRREAKHGNNEKAKEAGKEETVHADEECGEEDKGEK